jgi:hypothetical protein
MFGYWHLSDDFMFFGKYGHFTATTTTLTQNIAKYKFVSMSPVPSMTGKWAPKFDGTINTAILVRVILELYLFQLKRVGKITTLFNDLIQLFLLKMFTNKGKCSIVLGGKGKGKGFYDAN